MERPYNRARTVKILMLLFVLSAAGYLFLLFWINQRVETIDVSGCEVVSSAEMEYKVDRISCQYGYVEISGHAYEPGVSVDQADTVVLAYHPASGIYYKLPTENVKKEKLTKKADDGFNYDYAQFKSVTLRSKLPDGCRVCIWYRGNGENRLIQTEEVIFY